MDRVPAQKFTFTVALKKAQAVLTNCLALANNDNDESTINRQRPAVCDGRSFFFIPSDGHHIASFPTTQ